MIISYNEIDFKTLHISNSFYFLPSKTRNCQYCRILSSCFRSFKESIYNARFCKSLKSTYFRIQKKKIEVKHCSRVLRTPPPPPPPVFLAARLAYMLVRVPWPKYKRVLREHANWMFIKVRKISLITLPTLSPQFIVEIPILSYLRCFQLPQIIITPPFSQFKYFVWVANPLPIRPPCKWKSSTAVLEKQHAVVP